MVLGGIIAGHGRVLGARDGLFGQVHLRQRGHMDEFVRNASLEQTELLADQHPQFRRVIDEGRGHMDRACVGCGGRLRFYPHELDDAAGCRCRHRQPQPSTSRPKIPVRVCGRPSNIQKEIKWPEAEKVLAPAGLDVKRAKL